MSDDREQQNAEWRKMTGAGNIADSMRPSRCMYGGAPPRDDVDASARMLGPNSAFNAGSSRSSVFSRDSLLGSRSNGKRR